MEEAAEEGFKYFEATLRTAIVAILVSAERGRERERESQSLPGLGEDLEMDRDLLYVTISPNKVYQRIKFGSK